MEATTSHPQEDRHNVRLHAWRIVSSQPSKTSRSIAEYNFTSVAVVSIIRLTVLLGLDNEDVTCVYSWPITCFLERCAKSSDTGIYVPTCVWTNIEVMVGIVSASVPAFWPLLRAIATGSVRSANTRNTSVVMVPSHSHNQAKQFTGQRKIGDDEEGFFTLEDMAVDGTRQMKGAQTGERETGSPPPKPCAIARIQAWRE